MSKKEAAVVADNMPVAINLEDDADQGFEDADRDAYAIPFLVLLQSGSPQCKKSDGAYVEGAEEGKLFDSVTQEVYDGEEGIAVVPCHYQRSFVEFVPRDSGGGFVGQYNADDPIVDTAERNADNRNVLPNGNELNDTRGHYVLYKAADGTWRPALLAMTSTNLSVSKRWMALMRGRTGINVNDKPFIKPMFSGVYQLKTKPRQNDQGSWFVFDPHFLAEVNEVPLYQQAKQFRDMVKAGKVKTEEPHVPGADDEDPFGD